MFCYKWPSHSKQRRALSQRLTGKLATSRAATALALFSATAFTSVNVHAAESMGRFTVGGYFAQEKFSEVDPFLGDRNDVQTLSARTFLKVSDIAEREDSFIADLRDKHDFFDKIDKERLQLSDSNEFQVRQLSYGADHSGLAFRLGRFPIPDAGAVTVDGLNLAYRRASWSAFAFGGLNPLEYGKAYLQWRPNAQTYGAGLTLVPQDIGTQPGFVSSTAIVQELYSGETDRSYLYQNFDYPFDRNQRLYGNIYLDFVPKTQMQNGFVMLDSKWSTSWRTNLSYLSIDTVQYVRRQDVREQLTPSAYTEVDLDTKLLSDFGSDWSLDLLSGTRAVDGKTRSFAELRARWAQLGEKKNWDIASGVRGGRNFESNDWSARLEFGYFSRTWEATFEQSYGSEEFPTATYHPLITSFTVGRFFARSLLATFSAERIADERVEILSALFRLSYRFGSRGVVPVRDGSPPRGSL